jgi:hypothetical protein
MAISPKTKCSIAEWSAINCAIAAAMFFIAWVATIATTKFDLKLVFESPSGPSTRLSLSQGAVEVGHHLEAIHAFERFAKEAGAQNKDLKQGWILGLRYRWVDFSDGCWVVGVNLLYPAISFVLGTWLSIRWYRRMRKVSSPYVVGQCRLS